MKKPRALAIGFLLASLLFFLQMPLQVAAQDQAPAADVTQNADQSPPPDASQPGTPAQDPPSRVARLDFSSGSVSLQPGGEGDWVTAVTNRPLTTGDNLWADKDSHAELEIGSTDLRLSSETSVTFLDLDDHTTQLKLSLGSIIVRVRHLDDGDNFEIDTPNLAFTVQRTGEYRIDVNADGTETDATVWQGRGEATGGGSSFVVIADQEARFTGTDQLDHQISEIPPADDFDNWAFDRDRREDQSESANYISTEVTGYEDLDAYGQWHFAAGFGPVWTPAGVALGWAPYRFGHWVWIEPWGWTWVEDEPWGFAPFHYGRWAFIESSWCWVPGPVVVRPVYAPALVAFVGGGGFHFAVGVGPAVGWFPLAPGEVYVPAYRVSPLYVNNINITNTRISVTQVTRVYNDYRNNNLAHITYANQRVPSAVTAVSHDAFVNARPVARNMVQVDAKALAEAPVSRGPSVQPEKASVLGAGTPARVQPPAAIVNRQVVATRMPAPPRASLEQRQSAANVRTVTPGPGQPASRPVSHPAPNAFNGNYSHPLVRTAPPVQARPQEQQSEQSKFNAWQRQRQQRSAPAPRPQEHHESSDHRR